VHGLASLPALDTHTTGAADSGAVCKNAASTIVTAISFAIIRTMFSPYDVTSGWRLHYGVTGAKKLTTPYTADPARRFDAYSRKQWCARREAVDIEHGPQHLAIARRFPTPDYRGGIGDVGRTPPLLVARQ
jgi:hypothetical protein